MKIFLNLFLLLFWANGAALGQSTCRPGNGTSWLKSGNLEAIFAMRGDYFYEKTLSLPGLYWKNSSGQRLSLSFLNSIWFRGKVIGKDTTILLRCTYQYGIDALPF